MRSIKLQSPNEIVVSALTPPGFSSDETTRNTPSL
jgi:hypothetical protein